MNFQTIGGRRFLLTFLTGAGATLLQWFGRLDPAGSTYALVVVGTVGAFITGNVLENKHNVEAAK